MNLEVCYLIVIDLVWISNFNLIITKTQVHPSRRNSPVRRIWNVEDGGWTYQRPAPINRLDGRREWTRCPVHRRVRLRRRRRPPTSGGAPSITPRPWWSDGRARSPACTTSCTKSRTIWRRWTIKSAKSARRCSTATTKWRNNIGDDAISSRTRLIGLPWCRPSINLNPFLPWTASSSQTHRRSHRSPAAAAEISKGDRRPPTLMPPGPVATSTAWPKTRWPILSTGYSRAYANSLWPDRKAEMIFL